MALIEIYRARIDRANVNRLLEIRAAAVAEFQALVPELLQADLVRLEDDVWLDVLVWRRSGRRGAHLAGRVRCANTSSAWATAR